MKIYDKPLQTFDVHFFFNQSRINPSPDASNPELSNHGWNNDFELETKKMLGCRLKEIQLATTSPSPLEIMQFQIPSSFVCYYPTTTCLHHPSPLSTYMKMVYAVGFHFLTGSSQNFQLDTTSQKAVDACMVGPDRS
ncbi:hypothetical protein TWF718_006211 [Orbilia javanica]|uniref:Uncharacterized protein n=1 Tax=Orbilia javanica TaxID=47235 RepID=A0AAN8RE67_9PEZI